MTKILVITDTVKWALDTLYSPLAAIPGVTVLPVAVVDYDTLFDYDIIHFTYWSHYVDAHFECNRSIVTVHHLINERVEPVIKFLGLVTPDALVVSDAQRLCMFGEMGLDPRLIPYGIDKARHSRRTLQPDRFTVGWLGKEWDEKEYKRFRTIRAAAEQAGVAFVDGGFVIGEKQKYENTDDFFMSIDAYVVNSYIDAGPLPALEALSRGIPVLATPTGMMPQVIIPGENGLFHDGSVHGIAAAIKVAQRDLHRQVSHAKVPSTADWVAAHAALYAEVAA